MVISHLVILSSCQIWGSSRMDASLLLKGLLIGFSIAAPVGPIGVLCIRRTLAQGRAAGLASGLGVSQQSWLKLIGGAFLCYLGIRTILAQPSERAAAAGGMGLAGAYTSTFFLTLTNPTTILSFVAVFAGLGLASMGGDYAAAAVLVLGVFAGSALWWLLLSGGVGLFRARFDTRAMRWVNRISGGVITAFGLLALVSLAM